MNKLLAYILIFSLILSAQTAILDLQSTILYAYPEGWSDDIQLTPGDPKGRNIPDVDVCDYNNVWASWDTATWMNGTAEILYSKRDSLGNCLIPETAVSNNPSYSIVARVAVDTSNNVHFVWRDQTPQGMGLWHAKLGNDGTVLVPAHLAVTGGGGIGVSTEIALNKFNNINVAWEEAPSGYSQMSYSQLDTIGNPIITKIQVTPQSIYAYWMGIGVDSFANNHLACRTDTPGTSDRLTYSKLDKDGHILISNKVLATGGNNSIVSDRNQNIHIVYTNPAGPGNRIDYLKLDQDGNILIGPQTISIPQIASNTYPHVALDSLQYLHVVWQGDSSAVCHIMYCKMDTLGNYVIPAKKIVYPPHTNGAGEPRIVVDRSNRLHVVWVDGRLGSTNIFYKRGENEMGIEETKRSASANHPTAVVSPNPFSDRVDIKCNTRQSSFGDIKNPEVKIYDINGRLIKEFKLISSNISWDGRNDSGTYVSSGVYFLKLTIGDHTATEKLLLIR